MTEIKAVATVKKWEVVNPFEKISLASLKSKEEVKQYLKLCEGVDSMATLKKCAGMKKMTEVKDGLKGKEFETYVHERFGYSRAQCYTMLAVAEKFLDEEGRAKAPFEGFSYTAFTLFLPALQKGLPIEEKIKSGVLTPQFTMSALKAFLKEMVKNANAIEVKSEEVKESEEDEETEESKDEKVQSIVQTRYFVKIGKDEYKCTAAEIMGKISKAIQDADEITVTIRKEKEEG